MAYGIMSIGNAGFTKKFISALFLLMHPVGTPYASENPTSPAELYGGTWERVEGKFIMGASDTYPAGSTGGEAEHTLTESELPNLHGNIIPHKTEQSDCASIYQAANGVFKNSSKWSGFADPPKAQFPTPASIREITFNAGGDRPHNNLPPYIATYIWRRVA